MNDTVLVALASGVLALGFEYIPGLSTWYNSISNKYQRLLMLGLLVLVAGAIFGLNCAGWFKAYIPAVSCDEVGLQNLAWLLFVAITSNQGLHAITKRE